MVLYLGRLLQDIWSSKLRRDGPSRKVVVRFAEDGIEDLLDYEITLYQEHNSDDAG